MRFNAPPTDICTAVLAGIFIAISSSAQADIDLNAGINTSYQKNVNGSPDLPTPANQLSDRATGLNVSAVYFTPIDADNTRYFIGQVGGVSTKYAKYNTLDNSMLAASMGIYQQFSTSWSGQFTGRNFSLTTQQDARNAKGLGGTVEIKDQLSQSLWLKGTADYADAKANLSSYSYKGPTYGLGMGYLPVEDTFMTLFYSSATQDFQTVTPFKAVSRTVYTDVTQRLAKNWFLNVSYSRSSNSSNIAGTDYTSQILSAAINFSY